MTLNNVVTLEHCNPWWISQYLVVGLIKECLMLLHS